MDGPAFDELAKALRSASTRRQAAGGLLGLGLAALIGHGLTDAKARRRGKHQRHSAHGSRAQGSGGKCTPNNKCAQFCATVFGADTAAADQCASDGVKCQGLCASQACQTNGTPDKTKVCCVKANGVCSDYASAACCSGNDSCGGGNPGTPGVCGCTPNCAGKCGGADNGCGGTCDTCGTGQLCVGQTCVAGQGTCAAGADYCASTSKTCNGRQDCGCRITTEGDTRCGGNGAGGSCGECSSSAQCATMYPNVLGVFCLKGGPHCCSGTAPNGVCVAPCPAL
jgi:hypothetical protein